MKKEIDLLYGRKGGVSNSRAATLLTAIVPVLTTTQKRALSGSSRPEGRVVYDSTLNKLCVYTGEAGGSSTGWETLTSVLE